MRDLATEVAAEFAEAQHPREQLAFDLLLDRAARNCQRDAERHAAWRALNREHVRAMGRATWRRRTRFSDVPAKERKAQRKLEFSANWKHAVMMPKAKSRRSPKEIAALRKLARLGVKSGALLAKLDPSTSTKEIAVLQKRVVKGLMAASYKPSSEFTKALAATLCEVRLAEAGLVIVP